MQITIARRNGDLSESLENYVEKKLSLLTKHYGKIISAHVVLDKEGKSDCVEMTLRVTRRSFFSKDSDTNLRTAIDSCIDKLDKQLIKSKEKVRRKALTQEEAVLMGKVIVAEPAEPGPEVPEEPIIIFDNEEPEEEPQKKTGT